jgi:hypothetical protein
VAQRFRWFLAAKRNGDEARGFAVCWVFKGLSRVLFRRAHHARRRMAFV